MPDTLHSDSNTLTMQVTSYIYLITWYLGSRHSSTYIIANLPSRYLSST